MNYLSYDIRGIQRFIFAVPNLRCIIGASSQIAALDKAVLSEFGENVVYAGGGSGVLRIDDERALDTAKTFLREQARLIGVDLRLGSGEHFSQAKTDDQLYPFTPDSLAGRPCAMSGLLPVDPENMETQWQIDPYVHRLIGDRRRASKTDVLNDDLLADLQIEIQKLGLDLEAYDLRFFRNVNILSTQRNQQQPWDNDALEDAGAGSAALGSRNRWAVIAMDGNDAGRQHQQAQEFVKHQEWTEEFRSDWVRRMSRTLSKATRAAFLQAAAAVIHEWLGGKIPASSSKFVAESESGGRTIVLPIRPLIIGGDDVILLCHTSHAMTFVSKLAAEFSRLCEAAGEAWKDETQTNLWPASGNRLTISAGVLFVKNSYPLHAAIQYAENLLGSAKGSFRQGSESTAPMPSAVDFDVVTDTMLDTPAQRRFRELEFFDEDIGETVRLTRRPYLLGGGSDASFESLMERSKEMFDDTTGMPGGTRAGLLANMMRPWATRVQFLASHSRKHRRVFDRYQEESIETPGDGWAVTPTKTTDGVPKEGSPKVRSTDLIDAILLAEERVRDEQITAGVDDTPMEVQP